MPRISARATILSRKPDSKSRRLRPLKALGQPLADGLLDDAGPGEADQRLRLRDDHVAEHGEAGRHAAGGRVQQHRDVRQPASRRRAERRRRLGHLHEREDALLHARAARGREDDRRHRRSSARSKRRAIFSPTTEPIEPPMNSNTKKPTSTGCPSMPAEPRSGRRRRRRPVLAGGPQPIAVLLRIAEAERVDALDATRPPPRSLRGRPPARDAAPPGRGNGGSHCGQTIFFFLEVGREEGRPADGALRQDPRNAAFLPTRSSSLSLAFVPGHRRNRRIH